MTGLERRERERKESRHLSGMDKITHDVSQHWTVRSRSHKTIQMSGDPFFQASGEGGGSFYDGRDMTELECRERKRKESRHVNHHNVVCNECPQKYLMKNPTNANKVVLRKKWTTFTRFTSVNQIVVRLNRIAANFLTNFLSPCWSIKSRMPKRTVRIHFIGFIADSLTNRHVVCAGT